VVCDILGKLRVALPEKIVTVPESKLLS